LAFAPERDEPSPYPPVSMQAVNSNFWNLNLDVLEMTKWSATPAAYISSILNHLTGNFLRTSLGFEVFLQEPV
jgi:hypothetical protein